MFTVYVIQSIKYDFRYTGFTSNLERRLNDHNKGYNNSTKYYKPFKLIYTEICEIRTIARKREKFLKSTRGRNFLKEILSKDVPTPTELE